MDKMSGAGEGFCGRNSSYPYCCRASYRSGVSSTSDVGICPHTSSRFSRAHDMGLCTLCSGLPFTGFPRLSPSWLQHLADDREFIVALFPSHNPIPDPIGFPYHENIGALAESAKTCPLCAVVQAGVQAWLVSWHKAAGPKKSVEYLSFSGTLPLEERLWLTEIAPENQGFRVWAMNPWSRPSTERRQSLYLLTLVGFSVEERTFTPPISLTYQLHVWLMAIMVFPDSPLKDQFRLRPMDTYSGSSRSLDRAASWVQNCVDNHQECSDGSDELLPSRILDVQAGDTIALSDGPRVSGKKGKYACLSYCVS